MEYRKIINLLGTTLNEMLRFITKKWVEFYDQSGSANDEYKPNKPIRFKTSMLRSDSHGFSDAYIVVKGTINVTNPNNDVHDKKLAFKSHAPFVSYISKIKNTHIDNAEPLDIVMPMFNLLQYSKNYSKATGSFWNYYRDELNSGANSNINYSIKDSKFLNNKTSITRKLEGNNTEKEAEIIVPLKHLSNFWRTLDMPLINCKINLILTWSENCLFTSKATRNANPDTNPAVAAINNPTNATFKITDIKLYVSFVTLAIETDKHCLNN